MNVVLTREPPRNEDIRTVLSLAVNVDEVPATETQSLDPYAVAASCPVVPGTIVVTSSRAVSAAVALAAKFPSAVVAAVGRVTSDHLRTAGIAEVLTADDEGALGLRTLKLHDPVVSVGARETRPELATLCHELGLQHEHCVAYETHPRQLSGDEQAMLMRADVVTVAAPSAWAVVGPFVRPTATVIVRGETTASVVRLDHPTVLVAAGETATVAAVLRALFPA